MALIPTPGVQGDPTNLLQAPTPQPVQNAYPQGYITPDAAKAMYDYSQALLKNSMGTIPGTRGGWTVGLQHIVDALVGGQQAYQANKNQLGSKAFDVNSLPTRAGSSDNSQGNAPSDKTSALPEGAVKTASMEGSDLMDRAAAITSKQESGGNYANVTTTLNQKTGKPQSALGKYGVMDFNVAPWTKEILGKEMSPQEFLQNPQAQDAVYKGKMGQYIAQYGPQGAGRAWLGGAGGVNNPQRTDPLGTNVGDYGNKFALGFNGQPSSEVDAPGGQRAIALALAKGTASTPPTVAGIPIGQQTAQNEIHISPFAVPQRPHISEDQFRQSQRGFWLSPDQQKFSADAYYNERQPLQVPFAGGNVIVNPMNPSQQFFSPGIHWGITKGPGGSEIPAPQTIIPGKRGLEVKDLDSSGVPPGGAPNAEAPPPAIKLPEPITSSTPPTIAAPGDNPATPPAVMPAAPALAPTGASGAVVPPAGAPSAILASNAPVGAINDAGNSPVAQAVAAATAKGTPPAPAETPGQAVAAAQNSIKPPNIVPDAPPPVAAVNGAAPMGQKALDVLGAAPNQPQGVQIAESQADKLRRLNDMGLNYEHNKELLKSDAEQYTKNLQSYSDIGIRAGKALPTLEIAKKMATDPRYYSGLFSDPYKILQQGKAALSNYIGTDKAAAAPMEIFDKVLSGNIVTELKTLLGGLGQIRLAEINLITNSVANKYNTPTANLAVLNMMQRENQQAATVGQIATQYAKGWQLNDKDQWVRRAGAPTNAGLQEQIQGYTTRHPLFSDAEIQNIQKIFDMSSKTPNEKVPADKTKAELSQAAGIGFGTPANATEAPQAPAPPADGTAPAAPGVIRYDATGKRIQ